MECIPMLTDLIVTGNNDRNNHTHLRSIDDTDVGADSLLLDLEREKRSPSRIRYAELLWQYDKLTQR